MYEQNQQNILQIDVEDWYSDLDMKVWGYYESRVVQSTLKEKGYHATFFVLGRVAEQFPDLVKAINGAGHEIASHGYSHTSVTQQTPEQFEDDLLKSITILEGITGAKVIGYRAPRFTIVHRTAWAIDILRKNGLRYDSSVFPVKTHLYGVSGAPRFPYFVSSEDIELTASESGFLEIPLSVYRVPIVNKNLPIAGGFYWRFFPHFLIKHGLNQINKQSQPAVCYLHPWEMDVGQPRIKELSWYHYYRLYSTEKKFTQLLADFRFTSVREYLGL